MALAKQVRKNNGNRNNDWALALGDVEAVEYDSLSNLLGEYMITDCLIGSSEPYINGDFKTVTQIYSIDVYSSYAVKITRKTEVDGTYTYSYTLSTIVNKEAYRLGFMFTNCNKCINHLNIVAITANGVELDKDDIKALNYGAFSFFSGIGEVFDFEGKTYASVLIELDGGEFLKIVAREDNTISSFTLEEDKSVAKVDKDKDLSKEELEQIKELDKLFN